MRGQLSAEMLILIVVIIAIVGIAALQLMNTAKDASAEIEEQSKNTLDFAKTGTGKLEAEDPCIKDSDCKSDNCDNNVCK
jgi:uncharacterized protein (UPF0333 family)